MWRAIVACVDKFIEGIRLKVGCGDRIKFWTAPWIDNSTLASRFPSIYHLSLRPHGTISDFDSSTGDHVVWEIPLLRNLPNFEANSFSDLIFTISSCRIRTIEEDNLLWWLTRPEFSLLSHSTRGFTRLLVRPCLTPKIYVS